MAARLFALLVALGLAGCPEEEPPAAPSPPDDTEIVFPIPGETAGIRAWPHRVGRIAWREDRPVESRFSVMLDRLPGGRVWEEGASVVARVVAGPEGVRVVEPPRWVDGSLALAWNDSALGAAEGVPLPPGERRSHVCRLVCDLPAGVARGQVMIDVTVTARYRGPDGSVRALSARFNNTLVLERPR